MNSSSSSAHVLMVPFPESGHINPLMHLAIYLASNGILVTFVNTDYSHDKIIQCNKNNLPSDRGLKINLVSVPDGLSDEKNRHTNVSNFLRILENLSNALYTLISKLNAEGPPISCIISDACAGSTTEVANRFAIPRVAFWPATASTFALICHAISEGRCGSFPEKGVPEEEEIIKFARLPPVLACRLPWMVGAKDQSEGAFEFTVDYIEKLQQSKWILCNSVKDLEFTAIEDMPMGFPKLCTIGPVLPSYLMQSNYSKDSRPVTTGLWSEDCSCIEWLDMQETNSVLYISVGSIAVVNKDQLMELAYGLEATGIPVLWVVRPDMMGEHGLPQEFLERISNKVKLVTWAPQLQVLAHDAVGGFLTHNGWNSTIEAISMGVPMLVWPQFVDQFMNAELAVRQWGVGLEFDVNGNSLVSREIVADRVSRLMKGEEGNIVRIKALVIRDTILKAFSVGGSSHTHLNEFLHWLEHQPEGSKEIEPFCSKQTVEHTH